MNSNAKKLLFGRSISVIGDELYRLAVIWYIYATTQNAFYTGLATAITMLPKVLGFLIGPLVDHGNKKKILVRAQLLQALLVLTVPIAFFLNKAILPTIFIAMFLISFFENYQGTAEFSIIPHVVKSDKIGQFNSVSASVKRVISIAIGAAFALIISRVSVSQIYLINGVTYLLAFFIFARVHSSEIPRKEKLDFSKYKQSFKEGFVAFFTSEAVSICLPVMLLNFVIGIVSANLPAYATSLGSIDYFGYINLSMSIGMVIGTTLAMKLKKFSYLTKMRILPVITAILWVLAVFVNQLVFTLVLLCMAFIPYGILFVTMITKIQVSLPKELLGRIISIVDSVLVLAMPIGAILGGTLAETLDPKYSMLLGGISVLVLPLTTLSKKGGK